MRVSDFMSVDEEAMEQETYKASPPPNKCLSLNGPPPWTNASKLGEPMTPEAMLVCDRPMGLAWLPNGMPAGGKLKFPSDAAWRISIRGDSNACASLVPQWRGGREWNLS